jgi:hypothetical protein
MFFHEGDEVIRRVSGQRGFCEVRIGGDEIFGHAMNVREVAATSAGDEDFFADAVGMIEKGDAASALAGFDGAHESGGACAEDEGVEGMGIRFGQNILKWLAELTSPYG